MLWLKKMNTDECNALPTQWHAFILRKFQNRSNRQPFENGIHTDARLSLYSYVYFFSVFFFWPLLALTCGQGMEWHKEWKGKKIPITESAAYINLITQRWWRSRGNGENKMPHASTEFDIQTQFKIFAYFMRFLGGTGNPIPKKVYKKKMLKYANVIVCHGEVAWLRGCSRNVDWMNSTINESASTADA